MASIAFFPSLYGKAVPGLCFLSLSLISVFTTGHFPSTETYRLTH